MRTARTLSPGHPDKVCQLIAESIVDEYLRRDPATRMRLHVTGGKGALFVTGMVSSKADFDVGTIASRVAGSLGARVPVEPFVAIEVVGNAGLQQQLRSSGTIRVAGYATRETPEQLPSIVMHSRRIAKRMEDLRLQDPEWFWLEPAFVVDVVESTPGLFKALISCGHGDRPLDQVRDLLKAVGTEIVPGIDVRTNVTGPLPEWSIDHDIGSSAFIDEPYGGSLGVSCALAGTDFYHPQKFGSWLARGLAREALGRTGAKAVLVRAVYEAGDNAPSWFSVRDEQGKDLSQEGDRDRLRDLSLANGLRSGLNLDAMKWGFAGESGLPWEEALPRHVT